MRVIVDALLPTNEADPLISENLRTLLDILKQANAGVIILPASLGELEQSKFDFLVTENRGIHKEANESGLGDRILLVDEALQIFGRYLHNEEVTAPPPLKNEPTSKLDIEDPIFDTLKRDYGDSTFREWFKKISHQGRRSWVHYRDDGKIGALLIYKIEDEPLRDSNPQFPQKKRLKIATLKVTHIGYKIGELFIKMAIDVAIKNNLDEIYLTHYTEPSDYLVDLITEYGFEKVGVKSNDEKVYIKKLILDSDITSMSPIEISKKFYPSIYDGGDVSKFIIPIRPSYHNRLFTDFRGRQTVLSEHVGEFIVEGNTITKAYLTHSNIRKVKPGDLILFYRSEDLHAITSIGVVESVFTDIIDKDQVLKLVGKRTVFSQEEIEELVKKPLTVFLFRHHFHLTRPVPLEDLIKYGVIKSAPQSVIEISPEGYSRIKTIGGIDGRFTID